ncbi:MAG: ribbon-helix-helix protein, CopG family [Acidobacteriota bacterium]|nr:ribbon-helix-helix protein, CopG family [Acidobacteriota bacterium]
MPTQLTVRLPEDLNEALSVAAEQLQRKRSEVVRLALQEFLRISDRGETPRAERVRGLIGSLESGIPDLAENHRAHILESLKRGR